MTSRPDREPGPVQQKQKDAALAARGRAMHDSHRRQWESLKRTYAEGKAKIYGFGDTRRQQTADAVKEAHKPEWAALFRRQREEMKAFEARQRSPLGCFRNIAEAIRDQGWQDGTAKGVLGAVFGRASGQARAAFDQRQQEEREALAGTVRASVAGATAAVKTDTRAELARLRDDYLTRCEALKVQQDAERGALRDDWKARNDERREAFAPVQDRAAQWDRLRELGDASRTRGKGAFRGNDLSRGREPSPE